MFSYFTKKSEDLLSVYANDIQDFAQDLTKEAAPISGFFGSLFDGNNSSQKKQEKKPEEFVLNEQTFLNPIGEDEEKEAIEECSLEKFEEWKKINAIEDKTEEISQLLKENQNIENLHKDNVPQNLEYAEFWSRYFYRKLVFSEKKKKREILKKLQQEKNTVDELTWDDEEEEEENVQTKGEDSGENQVIVEEFRKMMEEKDEEMKKIEEKLLAAENENKLLKSDMKLEDKINEIQTESEKKMEQMKNKYSIEIETLNSKNNELKELLQKKDSDLRIIFSWIMKESENNPLEKFLEESHKDTLFLELGKFMEEELKKENKEVKALGDDVEEDYDDWE